MGLKLTSNTVRISGPKAPDERFTSKTSTARDIGLSSTVNMLSGTHVAESYEEERGGGKGEREGWMGDCKDRALAHT